MRIIYLIYKNNIMLNKQKNNISSLQNYYFIEFNKIQQKLRGLFKFCLHGNRQRASYVIKLAYHKNFNEQLSKKYIYNNP